MLHRGLMVAACVCFLIYTLTVLGEVTSRWQGALPWVGFTLWTLAILVAAGGWRRTTPS